MDKNSVLLIKKQDLGAKKIRLASAETNPQSLLTKAMEL